MHVDFTSILHSHTLLVPWAYCEVNMVQFRLFHQWKCLKCNGNGHSVSCVKWPWEPVTIILQALQLFQSTSWISLNHQCCCAIGVKYSPSMWGFHVICNCGAILTLTSVPRNSVYTNLLHNHVQIGRGLGIVIWLPAGKLYCAVQLEHVQQHYASPFPSLEWSTSTVDVDKCWLLESNPIILLATSDWMSCDD